MMSPEIPEEIQQLADSIYNLVRTGGPEAINQLTQYLEAGLPVDMANQQGNTLLMLAAYNGATDVVQLLIDRGADVDRQNDRGQTPLAGVVFKNETELVDILLDAGADPTLGQPSALETAHIFGNKPMADKLAGSGAGEVDEAQDEVQGE